MIFISKFVLFAAVIYRLFYTSSPCGSRSLYVDTIITLYGGIRSTTILGPAQEDDYSILIFTRDNPDSPITTDLSDVSQIDPAKLIKMYIHGWLANNNNVFVPQLKSAYLDESDCTVLILDWSATSFQPYATAVSLVPQIAQFVANYFYLLNQQLGIDLNTVHLIGHSLGAQMCGFVGQYLLANFGLQLGRVTGLDPAGPKYQGKPTSQRLDGSDAIFVDCIHTNEGQFGYCGDMCDVDFHVNGGKMQPACPQINLLQIAYYAATLNLEQLQTEIAILFACSHVLAIDYFVVSITSSNFVGKSSRNCPQECTLDRRNATFAIMGENCPANPPSTEFWVPVSSSAPYAKGCPPRTVRC